MNLRSKDRQQMNRGVVYKINLAENNLSGQREMFMRLMGQKVNINGKEFKVKGIEAYAAGIDYTHEAIGLLVDENN